MDTEIKLPLTGRQAGVLAVIGDFIQRKHYPPTITEIQQELGISNPGTVHRAISSLERKEYISKVKNVARGIRLTRMGAEVCARTRQLNLELKTLYQFGNP
ncbi:MAG: hypothetical protein RAO92_07530 [Candidatus Euphemobacter frigidus]|nr:hypothetical protein [Candidatus Euphemobacter frigidus]MDP8276237.1 hypothetical protein [Candidatus Euphemobacter frigidus]